MRTITHLFYSDLPSKEHEICIYLPEYTSMEIEYPVFLYFHGGGLEAGDLSDIDTAAEYLTSRNIVVVSANYRMYPEAVYPEFIRDAAAACGFAKTRLKDYIKPGKIFVGGTSAGGYISMMLCFDPKYLAPYHLSPMDFAGFIHDAGQPTVHYNICRERGLDPRRVLIDEAAPVFHIGISKDYPPMLFIISDQDMQNRPEQTELALSTMKHFGYDMEKVHLKRMHGTHCAYVNQRDEEGISVFGRILGSFIEKYKE